MTPKDNHSAPVDGRKPDSAAQLSPRSSSPSPVPLPTKEEREGYYFGASKAPLVARSSTDVWDPLGPDGSPRKKELGPSGQHDFGGQEQAKIMVPEIKKALDTHGVIWTSIDFARIGYEEEWDKPAIVWIGVRPGTITDEDGLSLPAAGKAAYACKKVLEKYDVLDVHCELRESEVRQMVLIDEGPPKVKKLSKREKRLAKRRK